MKLDDLESQGLIERVEPSSENVKKALERAQRDLRTARSLPELNWFGSQIEKSVAFH